jgi:hypothetical protein
MPPEPISTTPSEVSVISIIDATESEIVEEITVMLGSGVSD